jgi:3-oxoacyl-[acyl-carrier-protein] synthase I
MSAKVAVKAAGMVTAAGFNWASSCAAIRAGIRNVNQTNLWDKVAGEYLSAGKVPLPHWWVGVGKLAELVAPAIHECLTAAMPVLPHNIPVMLGVAPALRPFRFPELDDQILPEIEHRLGFRLHSASKVIPRDHVSVAVALRQAEELIISGRVPCCIVAGVDSLIQQNLVEHYIAQRRLLTSNNSNGFSVGEAGSAVLVTPAGASPKGELQILGMGLARETATVESGESLRAEGLVEAIREAFRTGESGYDDLHYRITDLNGEHYKFKEMTLAMIKFQRKPKDKLFDLWHPIEFIGDVGAAIGPVVLGVALHAGEKGYGNGPTVLCTFGNDDGERNAMVVHYESTEST